MVIGVMGKNRARKGDRECRGRELQVKIEWSGKLQ